MNKLNNESKNSTILSLDSLGQNDLIHLLDDTNKQNIKNHNNKSELFQAEYDILNFVTDLRKRTLKSIEEDQSVYSYQRKRTGKVGHSTLKKYKNKKNNELKKNLSFNIDSLVQEYNNRNDFMTIQKDKNNEKENIENYKIKEQQKINLSDIKNNDSNIKNLSSENVRNEISKRKNYQKDENEQNKYKSRTYKTFSNEKKVEIKKNNKSNKSLFHSINTIKKESKSTISSKKKKISKNPSIKSNIFIERSILEDEIENDNKNNFSIAKKPKIFSGDNDNDTLFCDEENKKSYIQLTNLTSKNILQLNELRKELKRTIVGKNKFKEIGKKSFLFDDDNYLVETKEENENSSDNNDNDNDDNKDKYRILTRKGYVYDSFDDEEDNDQEVSFNFLYPESKIILYFDFFDVIFSFYNLIFIPLCLGMNDIYFVNHSLFFPFLFLFNVLNDIVYFIDIIIPFFVAFYNFDEQLIIKHKLIVKNYLTSSYFYINLISGFPFFICFLIFNKKHKNNDFYEPFYYNNFYYLFILLRLLKIFKIYSKNIIRDKLKHEFTKLKFFSYYGKIIVKIFTFFISLHIVSCVFIFIGKNNYPNWIYNFNHNNQNFSQLYLTSIYYILTTLTTVGYGDLTCVSFQEKIFGLFIEIVGIFAYSWALTAISNYIKIINDKTEELYNRIKILDDIKISYPKIPNHLYERILRFLKYKHFNEKKGNHNIIDELPIGLRNTLIYEMYKPIINNFIFFKDFSNEDFIVKIILALKPILAIKNDILIKDGDLVEDIIFVKRGRLSLELPLIISFKKKKERKHSSGNSSTMNKTTLLFNNVARDETINQGLYNFNPNKKNSSKILNIRSKFSFKEEKEDIQYFRILEIRRNEHFGDILMFLDYRSPLSLKVKSKKAELFFLNREDAIGISTNYPQYWKTINKKSLFNMEQIKRLTNRLVNIVTNEHGVVTKKTNKIKKTEYSSSLSLIDDSDDDLKSIPTIITQESKEQNNFQLTSDDEKSRNKLSESYESSNYKVKGENNSNYRVKSLNTIMEDDDKESSDKFSKDNEYQNKKKTYKKCGTDKEKNIESNVLKLNNIEYKFKSYQKSNKEGITPYESDEINNEIYPEESFIISPQSNTNHKFSSKYINESLNLDSSNKNIDKNNISNCFNFNNISICSTQISFSINSEYENIDELSDHNYSKNKSFRDKIKNHIKKELKNIKNENMKSLDSDDNNEYVRYNFINKKTFVENKYDKRLVRKNRDKKHHTLKELNYYSNFDDEKKRFGNNKKDILTVISQKIENDNMNLNNPELFYSSIFMKFMDKKLIECDDPNMEMNKEEMDFIQRMENIGNLKSLNKKVTKK